MEAILPGLTSAPNIHPMVVHFPIAFWVAGTAAWGWALLRANEDVWRFGLWLQTLGAIGAAAATVAVFLASESLGHGSPGHDLVHTHRDFMLGATALSIGLTGVRWWMRAGGRAWKTGLSVAAVALVGVMSLGADRGAYLVYQHGVGVADGSSHQAPHSH